MDEQFKLAHKMVGVVTEQSERFVTLLRYSVDKAENPKAQVQLFARKKEVEKFQKLSLNYKLEKFIYRLDVMSSVYKKNYQKSTNLQFLKNFNCLLVLIFSCSHQYVLERWKE